MKVWWLYFDSAEIHGLLDDFMVVVQLQCLCIHGLVEGPGVGRMFLRQHLLQNGVAVFEMVAELALLIALLKQLDVLQVLLGGLDGPASALAPRYNLTVFGLQHAGGRLASAGSDGAGSGCGGVCFPLHPLLLESNKTTPKTSHIMSSLSESEMNEGLGYES